MKHVLDWVAITIVTSISLLILGLILWAVIAGWPISVYVLMVILLSFIVSWAINRIEYL